MGLAVDGSFVYLVGERNNLNKFGSFGDSRLYIGQYRPREDNKGVAPTVSITAPANGSTVVQGSTIDVTISATDDVAVAFVNLVVNGVQSQTKTAPPFQFAVPVPTGVASLTIGATASDLGANTATARDVVLQVIPDPLTTVSGKVIDKNGDPVVGATVTVFTSTTTSGAGGNFLISGVPTIKGKISATATVTVGGKVLKGTSASVSPVLAGQTLLGNITVKSASAVGYYDITLGAGTASQLPPITTAGLTGTSITNLASADLSQFDILFFQNEDNGSFSSTFTNNLAKVHQFVQNGGTLIIHDRNVTSAGAVLPGSPGTLVRSTGSTIDILDNTTKVTNGPGGIIDDNSLDGGNSSYHGYAVANSLTAGAVAILSTGNASQVVTYGYPYGNGFVIYSTIPLDYYLAGSGPTQVNTNMKIYAANVLAYAADR
jgi:hypothetical protein